MRGFYARWISRYHVDFYLPILVFWGASLVNAWHPAGLKIVFDFDRLREGDFALIAHGRQVQRDDLIFYRLARRDYVGRAIGVPGDRLAIDQAAGTVRRGDELVVAPRPGYRLSTTLTGDVTVDATSYAIYVHDERKQPFVTLIQRSAVFGPLGRYLRPTSLTAADGVLIALATTWCVILLTLPVLHFVTHRPNRAFRTTVFILHALAAALVVTLDVALVVPALAFLGLAWWEPTIPVLLSSGRSLLIGGWLVLALSLAPAPTPRVLRSAAASTPGERS